MSLPAARLGAVALAGAVLASGLVACSAPAPPTVQTVDAPTSSTTPSATPETSTSSPAMTTSTTSATTAPGATPSPTPPSRSTARTTPPPTPNKTPTPAPQPAAPTTPPQTGTDAYESQVLALVNAERTAAGLRPLAAQACPDGFAEPWSPRMAAAGSLSHQSLGPILTRCDARTAAENVGMNSSQSPISMVAAFMGSPPHRANILNPAYTGIGIGAYRDARGVWWLTQDFVG